jgi:hypothetical protein
VRRVTDQEITFYDGVASRISVMLGSHACSFTQSSLAARIGWNRASLCNFINRIDKGIAAHFIPRIAEALNVSVEHLVGEAALVKGPQTLWDPRCDQLEIILNKVSEIRDRNCHCLSLMGTLPLKTLPNHAIAANFANSLAEGASPAIAERWHGLIERLREGTGSAGAANTDYIIPLRDLRRVPQRKPPYQDFTSDEIILILENLKREWVRQRDLRIIAVEDGMIFPDAQLELSCNISLTVIGRETQIRWNKDLRIYWDDDPQRVQLSRDCLLRLKRSAGFGVRERPSGQQVERLIDNLIAEVELKPATSPRSRRPVLGIA